MLEELLTRDEILVFINEFLRPFALRNHLDMNHLFTEHIKVKLIVHLDKPL